MTISERALRLGIYNGPLSCNQASHIHILIHYYSIDIIILNGFLYIRSILDISCMN
jgi:hypothetical protein